MTEATESTEAEDVAPGALDLNAVVGHALANAERIVEAEGSDPEHRKARIAEAAVTLLVRWAEADSQTRELILPSSTLEVNARRLVHAVLG